jgi:hypothetical protein
MPLAGLSAARRPARVGESAAVVPRVVVLRPQVSAGTLARLIHRAARRVRRGLMLASSMRSPNGLSSRLRASYVRLCFGSIARSTFGLGENSLTPVARIYFSERHFDRHAFVHRGGKKLELAVSRR